MTLISQTILIIVLCLHFSLPQPVLAADPVAPAAAALPAAPMAPPSVLEETSNVRSMATALEIIAQANRTPVKSLLGPARSAYDEKSWQHFEIIFKRVIEANREIDINDRPVEFEKWMENHKSLVLSFRDQMGENVSVQLLFLTLYMQFKTECAEAAKDQSALWSWLISASHNTYLIGTFHASGWVLAAGLLFIWSQIKLGPFTTVTNSFLDKFVSPFAQKAGIWGSRLLGPWTMRANNWLFNSQSGDLKEDDSDHTTNAKEYMSTKVWLNDLGYDISPTRYKRSFARIYSWWIWVQQIFSQAHPPTLQNGRDKYFDFAGFRPKDFARDILQAATAIDVQMQAVERITDRIERRSKVDPLELDAAAKESFLALREIYLTPATEKVPASSVDRAELAGSRLIQLGASEDQAREIMHHQKNALVFSRFAAADLAAHLTHDLQFDENNRKLPEDLQKVASAMRAHFGLDYFHYEFADEVVKIMNETGWEINAAATKVNQVLRTLQDVGPRPFAVRCENIFLLN